MAKAIKPKASKEKIAPYPKGQPGGKTGLEGSDTPKFGIMPANGNFAANAGSKEAGKGGATKGSGGANADKGPRPYHEGTKQPLHPKGSGGAHTGSTQTLTKLIFHPKGGLGQTTAAKSPQGSGGFKDSGRKGSPQKVGVSK